MAQPNLIQLGESGDLQELSMYGRDFSLSWEEGLTREGRAASAKLRRDRISRKRNFVISYETADQSVVDRFEELYQVDDELVLEVTHLLEVKTYTVLMGEFSKDRLLAVRGGLWEGVSVEFREV